MKTIFLNLVKPFYRLEGQTHVINLNNIITVLLIIIAGVLFASCDSTKTDVKEKHCGAIITSIKPSSNSSIRHFVTAKENHELVKFYLHNYDAAGLSVGDTIKCNENDTKFYNTYRKHQENEAVTTDSGVRINFDD